MERKNNSVMNNSLKDHGIVTKAIRDSKTMMSNNQSNKAARDHSSWNSSCDNNHHQSYEEDYMNGFSWPPRSYTCSFCKREFRSAQALGGHMNVHRKDRARLRQSSPNDHQGQYTTFLNLNLKPNPNPNFASSSSSFSSASSTRLPFVPFTSSLSSLISPPLSSLSSPPPSLSSAEKWTTALDHGALLDHHHHPLSTKVPDSAKILKNERSERLFHGSVGGDVGNFAKKEVCKKYLKKAEKTVRLDLGIGMVGDAKEDIDLELRLGCS